MRLRSLSASFFNIQPGEGRSTSLMLAHAFFMGLSTVFFETAASALFLSRFGAETLPYVYLTAAALNMGVGVVYSSIRPRVSFAGLMTGTVVFLLLSTVGFRLGLAYAASGWLLFGLLVWYRVISILTDLEYWAVAGRLYDVRQAKRLFGFIGSGEVIARIAGAFSVPLLLAFTGVANLLLLSAGALASCLALLPMVLRRSPAAEPAPGAVGKDAEKRGGGTLDVFRQVRADRYLLLIVWVAFFAGLGKYFVDFAFLEQMRSRYAAEEQIASFFGIFSGVSQTLSLVTRLLLSGRLLDRYGVKVGLLVLPAAHAVCTMMIVACGGVPWAAGAVFWLVIANQGIYKTLKHPIDNPSFKVLYQPLRRDQRLATQIVVETIVGPATIGVAGVVMLSFSRLVPYHPTVFAYALLATFAAWTVAAVWAGREYALALVRALKGRIEDVTFSFDSRDSIAVLRKTLASGRPADVLFALDLLERTGHQQVGPLLVNLLLHPSPDVRLSVLLRIERLRPPGGLEAVRQRLGVETEPRLRAAGLRSLCAVGGSPMFEEVARSLEDPDPQIRMGAMIGLLRQKAPFALDRLAGFAGAEDTKARAWAARAIGEVGSPNLHGPLRALLVDPDAETRRTALWAAGRIGEPGLWPLLLAALRERAFCGAAASAFVACGAAALEFLDAAFAPPEAPEVLARIARILGRIRGQRAALILRSRLDFPLARVRQEVLVALTPCGYRAEGPEVEAVEGRLREEAADAAWKLAVLRDMGSAGALHLLHGALESELDRSRERIFRLLAFIHDPQAIRRARDHRDDESREKRAYALEVLDVTLSAEQKAFLMPLLDDLPQRSLRLSPCFPEPPARPEERLREVLARAEQWLTPWTQACAIDAVSRLEAGDLAPSVETLVGSGSATDLVRNTGTHTLGRLKIQAQPPAGGLSPRRERRPMQTIEKVITLKAVQMFAETSEDVLADVAAILEEMEFKAGEVIFEQGEVGDSMYIIIEGRVRVYDGDRIIVHLGERDIFGELALLDPEPRFASIAAEEDTRLFRLDREAFLELLSGNIEIVRGVLHVLCERLRRSVRETGQFLADSRPAGRAALDTAEELA